MQVFEEYKEIYNKASTCISFVLTHANQIGSFPSKKQQNPDYIHYHTVISYMFLFMYKLQVKRLTVSILCKKNKHNLVYFISKSECLCI